MYGKRVVIASSSFGFVAQRALAHVVCDCDRLQKVVRCQQETLEGQMRRMPWCDGVPLNSLVLFTHQARQLYFKLHMTHQALRFKLHMTTTAWLATLFI